MSEPQTAPVETAAQARDRELRADFVLHFGELQDDANRLAARRNELETQLAACKEMQAINRGAMMETNWFIKHVSPVKPPALAAEEKPANG